MPDILRSPDAKERWGDESIRSATFWDTPLGQLLQSFTPQSQLYPKAPDASVTDSMAERLRKWRVANQPWLDETSMGLGMQGGWTKVLRNPSGVNRIMAYHNTTNKPVGHIGYRQIPDRGGRLLDIKVDPSVRGQGYGRELVEGFEQEMGPLMRDTGMAGTISNSPGFWKNLAKRWEQYPIGKGILSALDFGGY